MKIYQLHEYDYSHGECFHSIKGSYLRKERAEEEKAKAEAKEKELIEKTKKCFDCPFVDEGLTITDIDYLFPLYPSYCNEMELSEDKFGTNCDNYHEDWNESSYVIKEIEVEE